MRAFGGLIYAIIRTLWPLVILAAIVAYSVTVGWAWAVLLQDAGIIR